MGRQMLKFPEDLRAYERFMWEMRANCVIELGVSEGGSTLWFRDRLVALGGGTVIAVDIGPNPDLPEDIRYIEADVLDPQLPGLIEGVLTEDARPFIVEDTAHTYETTTAALNGFHHLVPPGGYLLRGNGLETCKHPIERLWFRSPACAARAERQPAREHDDPEPGAPGLARAFAPALVHSLPP